MYNTPKELLDAFTSAPAVFQALLDGVTQEQAQAARGGDEGWSVVEVVCHLRDAEERSLERMRAMRDEDNPLIAGYDQEAWARDRNYAEDNLRDALAAFLRLREEHIAELSALSPDEWNRPGRHEEHGDISITGHTLHMVAHDLMHSAQIARQLGQASKLEPGL